MITTLYNSCRDCVLLCDRVLECTSKNEDAHIPILPSIPSCVSRSASKRGVPNTWSYFVAGNWEPSSRLHLGTHKKRMKMCVSSFYPPFPHPSGVSVSVSKRCFSDTQSYFVTVLGTPTLNAAGMHKKEWDAYITILPSIPSRASISAATTTF